MRGRRRLTDIDRGLETELSVLTWWCAINLGEHVGGECFLWGKRRSRENLVMCSEFEMPMEWEDSCKYLLLEKYLSCRDQGMVRARIEGIYLLYFLSPNELCLVLNENSNWKILCLCFSCLDICCKHPDCSEPILWHT